MSVISGQTSKAFPYSSFIPFYFNGLGISNDATTPNTKLGVAAGSCLDSSGTFQLSLSSAVTINAANNGLNGLDTGSLAASTVYKVFVVADPVTQQASGAMISASATPLLPYGYSAYALVGYITTDASVHFLKGYWSDNDSARRTFTYDAPIIALNAGTQTSYTGVALTAFVPPVANTPVVIYSDFTANAAADIENLQGYNSTGDAVTIIAPVAGATAHTTQQNVVLAQLNSAAPSIKYKVSAGSLSLYVCGYTFDL
jgi:hypothetical protein